MRLIHVFKTADFILAGAGMLYVCMAASHNERNSPFTSQVIGQSKVANVIQPY